MSIVIAVGRMSGVVIAYMAMFVGFGGVGPAHADPADGAGSCVYKLSAPFVVEVSGRQMVSATLVAGACTGVLLPNSKTVCVELQGGDMKPVCDNKPGSVDAQVYFAPYRAGATYVSTGTGCGNGGQLLLTTCATEGPRSATL